MAGAALFWIGTPIGVSAATVTGKIVDAASQQPVAARLYIKSASGEWFFARSATSNGTAIPYARTNRQNSASVECHTTLSADPFCVDLPPGHYAFAVERGKEFRRFEKQVVVGDSPVTLTFELSRWVNLAERSCWRRI
jgi:hypothetical protein